MKMLVIGGSGLIGSHVISCASRRGHSVWGTSREAHDRANLLPWTSGDTSAAEHLLNDLQPHSVIYTAGLTWADACEDDPEMALTENARRPAALAALCERRHIHFTYLSSGYVFDGRHGPYAESAEANPINAYGRSKLSGEHLVQEACGGHALIARLICVYGSEARQKNFACQVWRAMVQGRALDLPDDQIGNPTAAGDVAEWLLELITQRTTGLWHLAGPDPHCTRLEWADRLVEAFQRCGVMPRPGFDLRGVPTAALKQKAPRPLHAGLVSERQPAPEWRATDLRQTVLSMVKSPWHPAA